MTTPPKSQWGTAYDNAGRRTQAIYPDQTTETNGYDEVGRMTSKTDHACAGGACGAASVSFTYTNSGQRKTMADASGSTSYTYDTRDRLLTKQTPEGTLTYTYDSRNDVLSINSSNTSGASMAYTYDKLNRLSTVTDIAGVTNYTYDPAGNLAGFSYPNGVSHSYIYDPLNRLTNLNVGPANTCGTATPGCVASYGYTLGAAGNRTSVTELSGRTVQYGYDDLYRLTSETIAGGTSQNGTIGYTYDSVGNRKQITSTLQAIPSSGTLFYDANDRTATDTYDNDGNTVASGGITNVYDFENHLVQHGAVSIVYDGDGNRIAETANGTTTKYLVDTLNPTGYAQVVDELQAGAVVRTYTLGLERISQQQVASGQQLSYYGFDGHGSVRNLTDSTGSVTDSYDYDAFGNLIASTGSTPNNYLFAGEQFDRALGLYYNRARYLDVRAGRFWGMDTYEGDPQSPFSLHKYAYTGGNPVNLIDPTGKDSVTPLINLVLWLATKGVYVTTEAFGINAHKLIEHDIERNFPGTLTEVIIPGGRIDVIIPPNQIYDIKPLGGEDDPASQLARYIEVTNGSAQFPNGLVRGSIYFENYIDGPFYLTEIFYYVAEPGVIYYDAFPSPKAVVAVAATALAVSLASLAADLAATAAEASVEAAAGVP